MSAAGRERIAEATRKRWEAMGSVLYGEGGAGDVTARRGISYRLRSFLGD